MYFCSCPRSPSCCQSASMVSLCIVHLALFTHSRHVWIPNHLTLHSYSKVNALWQSVMWEVHDKEKKLKWLIQLSPELPILGHQVLYITLAVINTEPRWPNPSGKGHPSNYQLVQNHWACCWCVCPHWEYQWHTNTRFVAKGPLEWH